MCASLLYRFCHTEVTSGHYRPRRPGRARRRICEPMLPQWTQERRLVDATRSARMGCLKGSDQIVHSYGWTIGPGNLDSPVERVPGWLVS